MISDFLKKKSHIFNKIRNIVLSVLIVTLSINPALANSEKKSIVVSLPNGTNIFNFGQDIPTIRCKIFSVCIVTLEENEIVKSVAIGDSLQWDVNIVYSGQEELETPHVSIKPLNHDIQTNLTIFTDKRVYTLNLITTDKDIMYTSSFKYPNADNQINLGQKNTTKKNLKLANQGFSVTDLDFSYQITGDKNLMPVRVFNNGKQTVIEMPAYIEAMEIPTLVLIEDKKGVFAKKEEQQIVNYKFVNRNYIVDGVFNKALLISGVGSEQKKVTIQRVERL